MRAGWFAAVFVAALLGGCVQPRSAPIALEAVRFDQVPGWREDDFSENLQALRAECRRLALLPPDTLLGGQGLARSYGGRAGQWTELCRAALVLAPETTDTIRRFYETRFQAYRIAAPGLFTGYYEPEVAGALAAGNGYTVPLLARPADLVQRPAAANEPGAPPVVGRIAGGKLVPYWTRAEIEAGAPGTAARPLLWLRSTADLFFLQLQGAGRVRLPDGTLIRVGYDGKNGRHYTPIGDLLVSARAMKASDVSMVAIKAWLAAHPAEARAIIDHDDDYVFFRLLDDADMELGPPGALGVDLFAGRSAAVDSHDIPLGAPVFIDTTDPLSGAPWRHLLLAQDLDTDISGAAHIDIFFGSGARAEQEAGHMNQAGTVFLLLPLRPDSGAEQS